MSNPRLSPSQTEIEFRDADIVYLPGDLHDQRKAGAVRFSTPEARDYFANSILESVRPPPIYSDFAEFLAKRMSERVQGRRWMGAHMRRGDFVGIGWTGSVVLYCSLCRCVTTDALNNLERTVRNPKWHRSGKRSILAFS